MKELTSKEKMRASRYLFFILGLILWLIQGCAGVGPDLEKAREQNTEQAYLAFIEKYRDQPEASEQVKEARKAIILIKFNELIIILIIIITNILILIWSIYDLLW